MSVSGRVVRPTSRISCSQQCATSLRAISRKDDSERLGQMIGIDGHQLLQVRQDGPRQDVRCAMCASTVPARRRVSRPQWPRQRAGLLGRGPGLLPIHHRRRGRRAAGRRRPGRRGGKHDSRDVSAGNGGRLERQHRTLVVCRRHNTRPATRRRRVLRPRRGTRSSRRGVAVSRVRADQEPSSRSVDRAGGVDGQPRRARVRPLRASRAGRSAHRQHGEGHRRDAQGRNAARTGVAPVSG